ncbi:uncharacterized protein NDAI_0B02800 [Naumovozyma dairenensis CBS 421]|uniref:Autophagy protein Atg19/Atg34 C-terminal domain-containing protein n=1 Tax=Naumovozyma dairenensis (strain ATCC 10597 / BCRC 20456 / CBS 421 / NBRC 0211 / NRRL Y-12639) TaxID=1071378 RepID=G0W6A4_NAUDC|nr:hypothetical protein NDAI_0B02800 [Naumovozyma dairenensis CBS 421]CCD23315.1 hypothetical protein NDAI_0B02800 [Naumovozyma dairenensis CBS 421]
MCEQTPMEEKLPEVSWPTGKQYYIDNGFGLVAVNPKALTPYFLLKAFPKARIISNTRDYIFPREIGLEFDELRRVLAGNIAISFKVSDRYLKYQSQKFDSNNAEPVTINDAQVGGQKIYAFYDKGKYNEFNLASVTPKDILDGEPIVMSILNCKVVDSSKIAPHRVLSNPDFATLKNELESPAPTLIKLTKKYLEAQVKIPEVNNIGESSYPNALTPNHLLKTFSTGRIISNTRETGSVPKEIDQFVKLTIPDGKSIAAFPLEDVSIEKILDVIPKTIMLRNYPNVTMRSQNVYSDPLPGFQEVRMLLADKAPKEIVLSANYLKQEEKTFNASLRTPDIIIYLGEPAPLKDIKLNTLSPTKCLELFPTTFHLRTNNDTSFRTSAELTPNPGYDFQDVKKLFAKQGEHVVALTKCYLEQQSALNEVEKHGSSLNSSNSGFYFIQGKAPAMFCSSDKLDPSYLMSLSEELIEISNCTGSTQANSLFRYNVTQDFETVLQELLSKNSVTFVLSKSYLLKQATRLDKNWNDMQYIQTENTHIYISMKDERLGAYPARKATPALLLGFFTEIFITNSYPDKDKEFTKYLADDFNDFSVVKNILLEDRFISFQISRQFLKNCCKKSISSEVKGTKDCTAVSSVNSSSNYNEGIQVTDNSIAKRQILLSEAAIVQLNATIQKTINYISKGDEKERERSSSKKVSLFNTELETDDETHDFISTLKTSEDLKKVVNGYPKFKEWRYIGGKDESEIDERFSSKDNMIAQVSINHELENIKKPEEFLNSTALEVTMERRYKDIKFTLTNRGKSDLPGNSKFVVQYSIEHHGVAHVADVTLDMGPHKLLIGSKKHLLWSPPCPIHNGIVVDVVELSTEDGFVFYSGKVHDNNFELSTPALSYEHLEVNEQYYNSLEKRKQVNLLVRAMYQRNLFPLILQQDKLGRNMIC